MGSDPNIPDQMTDWMVAFENFLAVLTSLMMDRYTAFVYAYFSWISPLLWYLLDEIQAYWSDDISDTDSDGSNWEEW